MEKKLDLNGFQTVFRSFVRSSNLEDKVADNAAIFVELTREAHQMLKIKDFRFTANVEQFISQIGSIQNKTINLLGKSRLKDLVH